MDMSSYRLSFLEGLASPAFTTHRTVWQGTVLDAIEARRDRCKRIYQVLLTEAGPKVDEAMVDRLWVDAQVLVSCGRDLH